MQTSKFCILHPTPQSRVLETYYANTEVGGWVRETMKEHFCVLF